MAQNFEIVTGNEVANKVIHTAYDKLQLSKDPAVVYYIHTLSYLSKGSQRSDVKPEVKWLDKGKRRGEVVTPASTCLGFIDWYPNGAWGIHPLESGLAGTKAIAWSHIDAAHFLVNRLTRGVVVTVNGPPESTRLVTWGSSFFNPMTWGADSEEDQIYDLEFWDSRHGLQVGDKCNVELPLDDNPHAAHIFDGVVTAVTKQKVGVRGSTILDFRKRTD